MRQNQYYISLLLILPLNCFAVECMDWFYHLQTASHQEMPVYIIESKKDNSIPREFDIRKIPNTEFSIVTYRGEQTTPPFWQVNVKQIGNDGAEVEVGNNDFVYSAAFKNNACQNVRGYNLTHTGLFDKTKWKRRFNYDWKICSEVLTMFKSDLIKYHKIESKPINEKDTRKWMYLSNEQSSKASNFLIGRINKLNKKQLKQLNDLLVQITTEPFTDKDQWKLDQLILKCDGQTNLAEESSHERDVVKVFNAINAKIKQNPNNCSLRK